MFNVFEELICYGEIIGFVRRPMETLYNIVAECAMASTARKDAGVPYLNTS